MSHQTPGHLAGHRAGHLGRRSLLRGGAGVAGAALAGGWGAGRGAAAAPALGVPGPALPGGAGSDVVATVVSTPDFFNGDVGDLSVLPTWDGGPNSLNDSWRTATATCLDQVAAHAPDAVLVAGDLVEGRWNLDTEDRRLFGQVSQEADAESVALCRSAITAAGSVYYGHHRRLFAERGLRLLPAIGDHELLDDRTGPMDQRWSPDGSHRGEPDNRYWLVPHAKRTWADHFTRRAGGAARFAHRPVGTPQEHTAYRVSIADRLTVITVDMFDHAPDGVRLGVFGHQLAWLRAEAERARRRGHVVVVQGHVPVVGPYRSAASGGLRVPGGASSDLWRVLREERVDLFLCGEVHDTTAVQLRRGGPTQVTHGSIFRYGFTYLAVRVQANGTVVLDSFEVPLLRASRERGLWSSDTRLAQRTALEYAPTSVHTGRLVLRDRVVRRRTGELAPYTPAVLAAGDPWSHRNRVAPEIV